MAANRERLEADIRRLTLRTEYEAATTLALRGYGPEIYSFLCSLHRNEDDAAEVFSAFSERVWKGIRSFDWASSFRTWAYAIARNTSGTHRAKAGKLARRFGALPEGSELAEIVQVVRSSTQQYLRTEVREGFARLRDSLSEEDRMLLSLRLDRKLAWLELALVFRDGATPPTPDELKRESARLRQRFQAIKERLRALGEREGLLDSGGDSE